MRVRAGMEKFMEEMDTQVDEDHIFCMRRVLKGWFGEAFNTCTMDEDVVLVLLLTQCDCYLDVQ